MTTNFFQHIAALQVPGKWNMSIHTDEQGNFTLSALFTALHAADNATKGIAPMLLRGTAGELDEGFFDAIAAPAQQTAGLYHNLNEYAKQVEQARLNSKMEQDKKNKAAKSKLAAPDEDDDEAEGKPDAAEKRRVYDETMKQVAEFDSLCQYDEALAILPPAIDYPDKVAELTKRKADLQRKSEQKKSLLF